MASTLNQTLRKRRANSLWPALDQPAFGDKVAAHRMGLLQLDRRCDNVRPRAQAEEVAKDFVAAQFLIVEPIDAQGKAASSTMAS